MGTTPNRTWIIRRGRKSGCLVIVARKVPSTKNGFGGDVMIWFKPSDGTWGEMDRDRLERNTSWIIALNAEDSAGMQATWEQYREEDGHGDGDRQGAARVARVS